MKKVLFICAMVCSFGITANAQLGKPTTSVKDTFFISEVYYNGTKLNRADWPDTIIVEDALKVYVANNIYVKGKLKNSFGNKFYYNASCNGKASSLTIERIYYGYGYYVFEYTIDDYLFIAKRGEDPYQQSDINHNALYRGRGDTKLESDDNKADEQEWYESQSVYMNVIDGKSRKESIKIKRQAKFYGRHVMIPTPQLNGDINGVQGKVVVKVWVDRNGRVLKEECPAEGSTTTDEALIAATREAIHNARFSADENAPEEQVGTVAIIYEIEKSSY